jgi:hypothetical protein
LRGLWFRVLKIYDAKGLELRVLGAVSRFRVESLGFRVRD